MAQIIDFTAGLGERCIESIPQVHLRPAYRFYAHGRLVEVRYVERFDDWVWATEDRRWWDRDYLTGGRGYGSVAQAALDALNRIGDWARWRREC